MGGFNERYPIPAIQFQKMNKVIFLFIVFFLFSCNQKEKRPIEANMVCHDLFVQGQFKNATYSFCGITPIEIGYTYKDGNWKFWNLKGQLIAEGFYKLQKNKIENHGGCPYEIIDGIIDKEEWFFWNEEGEKVKSDKELIKKIESCTNEFIIS